MCGWVGGEIGKMSTMHHDGRVFKDMVINLTTILLTPIFVAIQMDFKWL